MDRQMDKIDIKEKLESLYQYGNSDCIDMEGLRILF